MHRKTVWLLVVFTLVSLSFAEAQPAGKVPRIGFLDPTSRAVSKASIEAFRQGLQRLGYTEGKNIAIDYRFAGGKSDPSNLVKLRASWSVSTSTSLLRGQFLVQSQLSKPRRRLPSFLWELPMPLPQGLSPASQGRVETLQA